MTVRWGIVGPGSTRSRTLSTVIEPSLLFSGDARREAEPADGSTDDSPRFGLAALLSYTLAPAVRHALEYDPERVAPVRPLQFPDCLEEGLLDHLLEATP
jgi:hypothetical protein